MKSATLQTFSVATNEFRGANGERTEYHACVAWDRLAEICGQFLSKGQLVDVDGRLQTRQWDDDAGKRQSSPASRAPTGLTALLQAFYSECVTASYTLGRFFAMQEGYLWQGRA